MLLCRTLRDAKKSGNPTSEEPRNELFEMIAFLSRVYTRTPRIGGVYSWLVSWYRQIDADIKVAIIGRRLAAIICHTELYALCWVQKFSPHVLCGRPFVCWTIGHCSQ